jgi:Tol biopolymer transport system component
VNRPADEEFDWFPAWSPDGTRLITTGRIVDNPLGSGDQRWSRDALQLFGADGSGFTRFTTPQQHWSGNASWSPWGTRIVFDSDYVGSGSLYTVKADGTDVRLILSGESDVGNFEPSWSPDGQWIVFARTVDLAYSTDLFLVRPDGTGLHRLLERPGMELNPNWSPDGKTIVFSGTDPDFRNSSIYTVPAAGGEPTRLTTAKLDDSPVYSPDGTAIAFERDPVVPGGPDDMHVWVMTADGGNPHLLTDLYCPQCDPDWQRVPPFPDPPPMPEDPAAPTPTPGPSLSIGTRTPPTRVKPAARPALLIALKVSNTSFRWAGRARVHLSVRLTAPARLTVVLRRAGASRALRTTVAGAPAGWTRIALAKLGPRSLRPGRYTLTAAVNAHPVSVSFRVRAAHVRPRRAAP